MSELRAPDSQWLHEALNLPPGETPFPWQERLLARFMAGTVDRSLDIPTGLGKTAVMAIWLVARAHGAALPRRLVYVVDRRAVVDQATDVAKGLHSFVDRNAEIRMGLGLGERSLPISTLRGQFVDNRNWLEDPASPAIVVGTVDMVGSRLLFEGYGTSRKMRPYLAGLLGADTMLVLDEAHLVPPFEKLLEAIADGAAVFGPRGEALRNLVPPFKLLSLSATGRSHSGQSVGLQDVDLKHPIVLRRLMAAKRLTVLPPLNDPKELADSLAEQAWKLTGEGSRPARCIVFCDKRDVAAATKQAIEKLADGDKKGGIPTVRIDTQLFVGGRRVFEREKAALWLRQRGFVAGSNVERAHPAFVIATSAGEVGIDLDADQMVSDLVAWERMVQRLGRVNRRGDGKANVIVVTEPEPKDFDDALKKPPSERKGSESRTVEDVERMRAVRNVINHLPSEKGATDASLGALRALRLSARENPTLQAILDAATTPAPLRPALSRALVDAWSMTSLEEHTGRPEIDPWLRGWIDDDPPQTAVVWRTHLPVRSRGSLVVEPPKKEIEAFFEAAPPHASEMLEVETFRVVKWLAARAALLIAAPSNQTSNSSNAVDGAEEAVTFVPIRGGEVAAVVLAPTGDLRRVLKLEDLGQLKQDHDEGVKKARQSKKPFNHVFHGATVILDARIGGLKDGLFDDETLASLRTADDGQPWTALEDAVSASATPMVRFRVRSSGVGQPLAMDEEWRESRRFAVDVSEDGEPRRWLIVEKWRHGSANEDDRAAGPPQRLDEHQKRTAENARTIAQRHGLPDAYVSMLEAAALVHDEGKRGRWQRAFNAPDDRFPYAKTQGPINYALLDGYRHEFGSLPYAEKDEHLRMLPEDLRDLALHLVAAHHGFARPIIRTDGCEDEPPSKLERRSNEVALRFARLQKRWGPWGLAWWESLLRAADQQASRENDATKPDPVPPIGAGR